MINLARDIDHFSIRPSGKARGGDAVTRWSFDFESYAVFGRLELQAGGPGIARPSIGRDNLTSSPLVPDPVADDPLAGDSVRPVGITAPPLTSTSGRPGDVAIIGYNTGQSVVSPATEDKLHFVALTDIAAGTVIHFTDRSWDGASFTAAAGDGTFSYTAPGGGIAAGTVITISQAQLAGAGIDINHNTGDTFYVYLGAANAPTTFLFAAEMAEGNTTFSGSLANTGLSSGTTAIAVAHDSAAYNGPTTHAESFLWNGHGATLLHSIGDSTNWVGDDAAGGNAREQEVQTGPWFTHADLEFWGTMANGGLANTLSDSTHQSGNDDFNHTRLYDGMLFPVGHPQAGQNVFASLRDMVFDTVDGKFFLVDSNISGVNRILQGNISDLIANPTSVPNLTVLFTYTQVDGTDLSGRLDNMEVDLANNIVYFTKGDDLYKVNYNTANQAGTLLFQANVDAGSSPSGVGNPAGSTSNFYNDMVIDFDSGRIYISSTRVVAAAGGDGVTKNFIYELSGLTTGSGTNAFTFNATNTGTARLLPFAENDAVYNPIPGTVPAASLFSSAQDPYAWAVERGTLDGLAIDPVNNILYFSTGEILFNHDANSGTAPVYTGGGVFSYQIGANSAQGGANAATVIHHQTAQFGGALPGLLGDLEVDLQNGHLYVLDYNGVNGNNEDNHWFRMNLNGTGIIQFTQTIGDPDGAATVGLTLNHAPTLTGNALAAGVTEASSALGSGETNKPLLFNNVTIADVDTTTADEITGAVVRISDNFQSGAGHQDFLRINDLTSGTLGSGIGFTYNSTTGAMVLLGAATVAEYKAAIELVTLSTSGDNITNYGAAGTRQVAVSVSDGLTMSDEIFNTITVTGINDAPVNTIQAAALGISEDAANVVLSTTGNAISVSDVDANPATQNITVTLSVGQGALTILTNVAGGIVAGDITGGANGGGSITITATQNKINATLAALNGLLYTPIADYNGADTLTIVTNDQGFNGNDPGNSGTGTSEQDSDTRTINIAPVVDIANDGGTTNEDAAVNILVLANDSFENVEAITAVTQGANGTVTIHDNGTVGNTTDDYLVYTANADFNGTDSFQYTVTSGGAIEQATVNVTISAVVDIANDGATTNEDTAVNVLVFANDSFEASTEAITSFAQGSNGSVALNDNGTLGDSTDDYLVYTPNSDFNGADSFTYTVTSGGVTEQATVNITINAIDDATDDNYSVIEDSGANTLGVLGNDNFESAGRFISAVTQGAHGSVAINDNGTAGDMTDDFVVYTVTDPNYSGPDSFTYTVTSGGVTEQATVNITIEASNDAPTSTNVAGDTIVWAEGDSPQTLDLGTNATLADLDSGDFDTGTLTVSIGAGKIAAEDELSVQDDANVTVTGNTISVSGFDIATFTGGGAGGGDLVFSFDPDATPARVALLMRAVCYSNSGGDNPTDGDRTISWTLVDGDGVVNAGADTLSFTTTVNVNPVDDAAVAANDAVATDEATPIIGGDLFADNGSGADFEPDGPPLQITAVNGNAGDVGNTITLASGASLKVNADGSFDYDPNGAFDTTPAASSGASNSAPTDIFTYEILGGSAAMVTVTINGIDSHDLLLDTAGDDTINAGIGRDTLIAGAGADDLDGGDGIDWVRYGLSGAGVTITLSGGAGSGGHAEGDVLADIEWAQGSGFADSITGDGENNRLDGLSANDTLAGEDGRDQLRGRNGDDSLLGGNGADDVRGGAGADTMDGGLGFDRLGYKASAAGVDVDLLAGTGLGGDAAGDAVSEFEHLAGSLLADTLTGDDEANRLSGRDGDDALSGGGEEDTLTGGAGIDTLAGGAGNDGLKGGADFDIFVFTDGFGRDVIVDFESDDAEKIDLSGVTAITDFADLAANHLRTDARTGWAEIFDGTDRILLVGFTVSQIGAGLEIDAGDFLF